MEKKKLKIWNGKNAAFKVNDVYKSVLLNNPVKETVAIWELSMFILPGSSTVQIQKNIAFFDIGSQHYYYDDYMNDEVSHAQS